MVASSVTEQFGRFSGQPSLLDRIGCRLSLAHDVLGRELPQVHRGHSQIDAKITMPPSSSVPPKPPPPHRLAGTPTHGYAATREAAMAAFAKSWRHE